MIADLLTAETKEEEGNYVREIVFRGKRKDNGEWIYGELFTQGQLRAIRNKDLPDYGELYEVDPKTVGQYTGLNDCIERKIFEGDIVKGCAIPSEGGFDYLGKVVFYNQSNLHGYFIENSDGGGWRIDQAQAKISLDNITGAVIGNVHDNSELLGGNKDVQNQN